MAEPFNPSPFWDNTIVNLSGAQKFEEDTVFPAGRYSVDVQAGGGFFKNGATWVGFPGRVEQEINITAPFIIRAYCGGAASSVLHGINPYSGEFKVNAYTDASNVPSVSHIFGNSGSTTFNPYNNAMISCTSGNCLGNGSDYSNVAHSGAGSCLHFVPVNGVFGTDYLAAVHVTAASMSTAGSGSAYGGAGSGMGYMGGSPLSRMYSFDAGSTPYGAGGQGVQTQAQTPGNDGAGIGHGNGGNGHGANGVGAWFDGTIWCDSRTVASATDQDGHIIVKYIGTIN